MRLGHDSCPHGTDQPIAKHGESQGVVSEHFGSEFAQLLIDLMSGADPHRSTSVITFNYDLACDFALNCHGVPVDYALGENIRAGAIPLLKRAARDLGPGDGRHLVAAGRPHRQGHQGGQAARRGLTRTGDALSKDKHWDSYIDHKHSVGFYVDFLRCALDHALTEHAALYQWFGIMRAEVIWQSWREVGLLPHQVLIWKKSRSVLTYSHFMWDYEPMMYGWREGHMPKVKPPADSRAVWEIESKIEDAPGSVHPTMKPVETIRRPIAYHTRPGELIYEPFCGSGTALIAAEELGRSCYALEQSPQYVDVAVARWEAFSGRKATRERDGRQQ